MIKVCILTLVHPPLDTRIFHKEAKSLNKAGYDVAIISQIERNQIVDNIKLISFTKPKNRFQRMTKTAIQIFKLALKARAQIYHFHDPELILVGLLLKIYTRSKVIYDVHEDVSQQILTKKAVPQSLRRLVSIFFDFFEKKASPAFDSIICVTEAIAARFLPYNKDTSTVRNYISKFYAESNYARDRRSPDELNMIFIGSIYEERCILEAIEALNMLGDLKINFILGGEIHITYYQKIISKDEHGRVVYKGILPYEQVLFEMHNADIGYICDYPLKRHMEGLPVKLFEYMAVGIPVIASNFPLWNEIVNGSRCGITVNPLKPEEIACSIRKLYDNVGLRCKMGNNGRNAIINQYNWEKEFSTLLDVYKRLEGKII